MVEIVYHVDLNEAQGDLAAAGSCAAGPFDRAEWFALLLRHALADSSPLVAVAREGDRVLALPLIQTGPRALAPLANWYSFWWRPLGDLGLLQPLARVLGRRCDVIRLDHLPEDEAAAIAASFRACGWAAFSSPCDANHVLPVKGRSFAEYWASRHGRLRETVRRKSRKEAVTIRLIDRFDQPAWNAYEAIYQLSWKPGEGSPDFLLALAMAEGSAGRLRMGLAEIEGQPVAAQFWTVEAGTAFIHKLAHDERAKAHSPGTLLTAALFEHVIDRDKVELVDFGTGDDPYKRDWMEQRRERHAVMLYRKGSPAVWPRIAREWARRWLRR